VNWRSGTTAATFLPSGVTRRVDVRREPRSSLLETMAAPAPATSDDKKLFDEVFRAAAEAVSDMVTGAMRKGLALGQLGVVIERHFDGRVVTGCALRADLARRFGHDPRLPEDARQGIAATMTEVGADGLPIIVVVHRGEGLVAVGVRRERGQLVSVS
jgi:hypothetical protein